jgi:hypothetical protein
MGKTRLCSTVGFFGSLEDDNRNKGENQEDYKPDSCALEPTEEGHICLNSSGTIPMRVVTGFAPERKAIPTMVATVVTAVNTLLFFS